MVESSFLQVVTADCGLVLRWGDSARHAYLLVRQSKGIPGAALSRAEGPSRPVP